MLKQIVPNDLQRNYVIITPDRRTLMTEQQLFEVLQTDAFFNVNVTTLTRYTNQMISQMQTTKQRVLKKPSAVAIIKKIMLEQRENLRAFAKATKFAGTANAVFETISMFKSCNVQPQDLQIENLRNQALKNKMQDLRLIYEQYETYLQTEYTDSFNKLTLLSQLLENADLKQTHFLFVGFDDFTPQTYEILGKLMAKAGSVSVSCSAQLEQVPNKSLFTNNTYYNLLDVARIAGVTAKTIKVTPAFDAEKQQMSNNLFASVVQPNLQTPNRVQVVKFAQKQTEVEFVAKTILWQIKQGKQYKDFVVLTPNIKEYLPIIKQQFRAYNIPIFVDQNKVFSDHVLARFLLHLLEIVNTGALQEPVLALLKTVPQLDVNLIAQYETILNQTGLQGEAILKPFAYQNLQDQNQALQPIFEFLHPLQKALQVNGNTSTVYEWVSVLQQWLNELQFEDVIKTYLQQMQTNNMMEYRLLVQVQEKIKTSLQELQELLQEYECSFADFSEILQTYLQNINLSLPPLAVDVVFVADSVNSFVNTPKVMFCLGANAGVLPVELNDLGIISDDEINRLNEFAKLTPTVAMINKRNKLGLYEKLLQAQEKLFVSYLTVNEKNETLLPSVFVENITNMFSQEFKTQENVGEVLLQVVQPYGVLDSKQQQRVLFNNPNQFAATQNFIAVLKDWMYYNQNAVYLQYESMLEQLLSNAKVAEQLKQNLAYENEYDKIEHAKELYFASDFTSVSQFESYFNCPFKHFVEYGLKLQETTTSEIDARQFGIMLHEFVALVMPLLVAHKKNKDVLQEKQLTELAQGVFAKVLQNPDYELVVKNPYHYHTIKALKLESVRVTMALWEMEQHSKYDFVASELLFGKTKQDAVLLQTEQGNINLKGVIDRVDEFEETYRIIDYKSGGSTNFTNFTDVVSGHKVQLFVYIKGYKTTKKCVGTFYLPIKDEFVKDGKDSQELYKLQGVLQDSLQTVCAMDDSLLEPQTTSKILPLARKKDGEFDARTTKYLLNQSDIEWVSEYAILLMKQAFLKMLTGDITPYPYDKNNDKKYKHTKLIGLNNFDTVYGNQFRTVQPVPVLDKEKFVFELNVFSAPLGHTFTQEFTLNDKK